MNDEDRAKRLQRSRRKSKDRVQGSSEEETPAKTETEETPATSETREMLEKTGNRAKPEGGRIVRKRVSGG